MRGFRAGASKEQAAALAAEGRYDEAIPLKREECDFLEDNWSPTSRLVLECLAGLAVLYREGAKLDEAETLSRRVLTITLDEHGPDDPRAAKAMLSLGAVLHGRGALDDAEALYRRGLEVLDANPGDDPWTRITGLASLSTLRMDRGDFAETEALIRRALALVKESYGDADPAVGELLANLGEMERRRGRLPEAEALLRRAVSEASRHPDRFDDIAGKINLAGVLFEQGAFDEAQELLGHCLTRLESTLGPEHSTTALVLNDLGVVHYHRGEILEAQALLERSAAITERRLGPEHPEVALGWCNVAAVLLVRGETREAELLSRRGSDSLERALGPDHPSQITCLHRLASSYMLQQDFEQASIVYRRALSIAESRLGPHHREVVEGLSNLGLAEVGRGQLGAAVELQRRASNIEDARLGEMFTVADDARRLDFAVTLQASTHYTVSLHMRVADDDESVAALALETVLRRKGRAQDLSAQSHAALRRTLAPQHQHLFDDLQTARAEYAALARLVPSEEVRARLTTVEREQQRLWSELRRHSPAIRDISATPSIADVQRALPTDSVLIEMVWYQAVHDDARAFSVALDEPRYAAYLVFRDRFAWVDLGPANVIDEQVAAFRRSIQQENPVGRGLYEAVIEPMEDELASTPVWFIAPDEALNLVPFGAVHDGEQYLVERQTIRYLSSGRDLLPHDEPTPTTGREVLLVANPTHSDLPGSEIEAERIAALFPRQARTLLHDEANAARIAEHPRPWLLHVAAHGFFGVDGGAGMHEATANALRSKQGPSTQRGPGSRNPMLQSGLQLAPTTAADVADDGLLTAYEVSGWDLRGTELVVLSACESGLGALHAGEGVLGLRRALGIAGAQTVVVSLWKVSDAQTLDLMGRYYGNLLLGMGRAEAMQATQLELLRQGHPPDDWASFVAVGDWTPLERTTADAPPTLPARRGCTATIGGERPHLPSVGLWALLGIVAVRRRSSARCRG